MNDLKTTNRLLLIIVIPLVFYLLKILSFIFIPLIFSMFITLLFLPLMRWLQKKRVSKPISILIVILVIAGILKIGGGLVRLSSKEILSTKSEFLQKVDTKARTLILSIEEFLGIDYNTEGNLLGHFFQEDTLIKNFGTTLDFVGNIVTMILMTAFFVILWLAESINIQKVLNEILLKGKHSSIRTFRKIEKDLITFIKVKFLVSLLTGIGIGLACYFFGVSFPIFWGLFAFVINFVQMIGSVISVVLLAIFSLVELEPTSTLFFFILTITGVQVLFGSIVEPVFMGKSFSINIITVLVMLMLWGYIWGVPGLIMSIPITVFLKIILEQFPNTKVIANLLSGKENAVRLTRK
ncbi:AI-2E family transporter [Flavobacteriaceae bacterium F89]|uniref:AI-2E family transporter n=1 Tax=Cerina litoralis TaxID=2874477 RepID=A0AAE3EV98_9FLAO|nr:AI-2E family transporter [Cerina litoralis]MCG2461720.1 AI-2E family transporter [Cerina litoralis]